MLLSPLDIVYWYKNYFNLDAANKYNIKNTNASILKRY